MRELLDRIDGGRVLNVGCVGHDAYTVGGRDWLHHHLAPEADELVGIDIDRAAIEELQAVGWDVWVDDATTLKTIETPVDVVVAGEVIEHLDNPGGLFRAARDVLAPDGRLLVTTPNPWALCYVGRAVLGDDPVGNDEHTCWIDATTLEALAARFDFTGTVEYVRPMACGLTWAAYRTGHHRLGGTRLLGEFTVEE